MGICELGGTGDLGELEEHGVLVIGVTGGNLGAGGDWDSSVGTGEKSGERGLEGEWEQLGAEGTGENWEKLGAGSSQRTAGDWREGAM